MRMMTLDRYYYMSLDENAKAAYRTIYSAIVSFSSSVSIENVKEAEINEIIDGILLDNPHLFYLDLRGYTYCKFSSGFSLSFSYLCTKYEMESIKSRIEEYVKKFVASIDFSAMSDYQKEICIHDYLCRNIQYDNKCIDNKNSNILSHTIWGVFIEKKAVCDGISKAFKYMCNIMGIKCIVEKGRADDGDVEKHTWNIIKLDGQAYQVDVTWDLNRYDGEVCKYYYFNLPDEMMYLDHKPNYTYPQCSCTTYTYLFRENQVFCNKTDFIEYITNCLLRRKKIIDYRLLLGTTKKTIDVIVNECFKEAVQRAYVATVSVQIELNHIQSCGRFCLDYKEKNNSNNYSEEAFNYDLLDGHAFEYFCADLLKYNGFEHIQVTSGSGDFGVDILCEYKSVSYAIQCKCYANTVGNKAVQEIFSGKVFYHCEKAVVITNNYFTAAAEETARLTNVELWDRGRLNELYHIARKNGYFPQKY